MTEAAVTPEPAPAPSDEEILTVSDLHSFIATDDGVVRAVDGVSFTLRRGEILGLVGESGSGKSVTCRTLMGLMPSPPTRWSGDVRYAGLQHRNLLDVGGRELQRLRGAHLSMIFQDPMSALNPVMRVGDQIEEAVASHDHLGQRARRRRAIELLDRVGIPAAERRMRGYPHEFSGGMRQRALIAVAIASRPKILFADEPTTALDVIIQDQILSLLLELQRDSGMSMVLVSHDLGVIAEMCDRIAVMYAGQIVELGDTETLLTAPRHPYTISLLRSLPDADVRARFLPLDRRHAARADRPRARLPLRTPLSPRNPRVPNVGDRAPRRQRRRPARPLPAPRRCKEARRMAGAELRVGVIGTGRWAKMAHLPGWSRDPRVQLVAVCDADEAVAAEAAEMFGVAERVTDHRAVIERDDIDVIDVVHRRPRALRADDGGAGGGQARARREAGRLRLPRHAPRPRARRVQGAEDEARLHLPVRARRCAT